MGIKELSRNNKVGMLGERLAREAYRRRGYNIVETNAFNRRGKRMGEIDFVAASHKDIVFVEVKTRMGSARSYQDAVEAVGWAKRRKLLTIVRWYLVRHPAYAVLVPRIDVCVVQLNLDNSPKSVIIIPNAVEAGL